MAGRPPKPTHLKLLQGNPGNRPLPVKEPQPARASPDPPPDLVGEALAEWNRVVPELARLGLVSVLDRAALVVYCQAWEAYNIARQAFAEYGPLVPGRREGELIKNPAAQVMRDQADLMSRFGSKFGLTPSDRARLSVPEESDGADDIESLLG